MSEFRLPHIEDLTTNTNLPGQLTEDMKLIQQILSEQNQRIAALENQVERLQTDDEDYRKRLEQIEKVLFEGEPINLTTTDTDVKHYQTRVIN